MEGDGTLSNFTKAVTALGILPNRKHKTNLIFALEGPLSFFPFHTYLFATLGDHEGRGSGRLLCIAQRGGGLSRISFGGSGGAIFDVPQISL